MSDHSTNFGKLRPRVVNSAGVSLIDFVKTLQPRYAVVYRDIALGHVCLFGTLACAIAAESAGAPRILIALVGALSIGYWIAYLQLFIHEGAHWNLAPDKERSDRLCNLFISWLAGLRVQNYRQVHFQHHRAIGTADDSEQSYFYPLNLRFFWRTSTGAAVREVLKARSKLATGPRLHSGIIVGFVVHLGIVGLLLYFGLWGSAAAWAIGATMVFPTFGALRQVLEHRDDTPGAAPYSAVTRVFGDGPIASTFGGAGFNRHLLHHWELTVSYTRLRDLERFAMDTQLRDVIAARTTTYGRTFMTLLRAG